MSNEEILSVIESQKEFYEFGNTLNIKVRIEHLKNLRSAIYKYMDELYEALYLDLNKSKEEAYMCEIGLVLSEIGYHIKHIKKFSKPKRKKTPLFQAIARSYEVSSPYGNVLVMSPWNYPFLLAIDPLVEAVAAGNTVMLKTSEYSPYTSKIIKKIVNEAFDSSYCDVVYGGLNENQLLINQKWDYVFFTGSKKVGHIVYEAQSKYLTPVTLELGGKSPVIIDKKVNIKLAARRIAWGKIINSGQTCVAPDYLYVHEDVYDEFIKRLEYEFDRQAPDAINNKKFCKIINQMHFDRAVKLLEKGNIIYGGKYDSAKLKIEPTLITNVTYDDIILKDEIFAPILPIIKYNNLDECIKHIKECDTPLAFYVFSKNKKTINKLINNIEFGGGCVNDVVMHLATTELGFGGFKESGMGSYHGKYGFDIFSHKKSVLNKSTLIDMPMRYNPDNKIYNKVIKMFLK